MKTNTLSNETIQKLISGLDEQIKQAESKLADLRQVQDELRTHLGNDQAARKPAVRRLPPGLPKKLVTEALQKHKRLSIGQIMGVVKVERSYTIKDGSTRRALDQLMEAGLVIREEDGTYRWLEDELI